MLLGYNTNGFTGLDAIQAINLVHSIGYDGIALSLDRGLLDPFTTDFDRQLRETADRLDELNMRTAIETGARFLLDPRTKHEPTLVSADPAGRARRVDFLCRAIDIAAILPADCVSLWSGILRDAAGDHEAMRRLTGGLATVLDYAGRKGVVLAFEPEPGMFIDSLGRYADLLDELTAQRVDTARLRLTIDIGHLHCQGELSIADRICQWRHRLTNIHIEDMRFGVHEHLMFGDGEIDFRPVIAALAQIGYAGLVNVELSRHSHEGPAAARQAYKFLRSLLDSAGRSGGDV